MDSATLPVSDSADLNEVDRSQERQQRRVIVIAVVVGLLILACLVTGLIFLLNPNLTKPEDVARIRDVFIIIMALESLLIGAVLVILIVQVARLTNLLQNLRCNG